MNMTQANPYCFEFKFNRMNPLNLTNEDFGEIQIFSSTYRRDPQQRSREFFRQFKLTQIATIMPNETYVRFLTIGVCPSPCSMLSKMAAEIKKWPMSPFFNQTCLF